MGEKSKVYMYRQCKLVHVESSGVSLFTGEHTKYTTHSFPFSFYEVQVIKIRKHKNVIQ
jgi:hypothetical protein